MTKEEPIVGYEEKVTRILAATDLSDESRSVLPRSAALARQFGAELDVLYVAESSEDAQDGRIHAKLERDLDKLLEGEVTAEVAVRHGVPGIELLKWAKARQTDLFVLGFHHQRAFERTRLGSNMRHVLVNAEEDVLLVDPSPAARYRSVVVAWDGHKPLGPSLERAHLYAPEATRSVFVNTVLYAEEEEMRRRLEDERRHQPFDRAIVGSGSLTANMQNVIYDREVDLLVLPTRGNQLGDLGYIASELLAQRYCDTLCCQKSVAA